MCIRDSVDTADRINVVLVQKACSRATEGTRVKGIQDGFHTIAVTQSQRMSNFVSQDFQQISPTTVAESPRLLCVQVDVTRSTEEIIRGKVCIAQRSVATIDIVMPDADVRCAC